MTEAQIAANNAVVLAARNAAEQKLREQLSRMKGRKSSGRKAKNWENYAPDAPAKVFVKAKTARALSERALKDGVTVSLLVEIMVDSYLTAPAEHRMLAEMLHAVKKYEKEAK